MEHIVPWKIQIATILVSLLFLSYIARLIIRGRLREEYAFIWVACTVILLVFSIWRDGLGVISYALGVFYPPSLVFMGAIFAILIYLLHLSVEVSRLRLINKNLAQKIALIEQRLGEHDEEQEEQP